MGVKPLLTLLSLPRLLLSFKACLIFGRIEEHELKQYVRRSVLRKKLRIDSMVEHKLSTYDNGQSQVMEEQWIFHTYLLDGLDQNKLPVL